MCLIVLRAMPLEKREKKRLSGRFCPNPVAARKQAHGPDMSRHDDRDTNVGCIYGKVGDKRLGKPLDGKLGSTVCRQSQYHVSKA